MFVDMYMVWYGTVPYHTIHTMDSVSSVHLLPAWTLDLSGVRTHTSRYNSVIAGFPLPPRRDVAPTYSEIVDEDGEKDSDEDDDDDVEMQKVDLTSVTTETIDELCAQLGEIAGKLKKLKCEDGEFEGVASQVTDATSSLRLAHSRHERNRVAKKQSKAPRQTRLATLFLTLLTGLKVTKTMEMERTVIIIARTLFN